MRIQAKAIATLAATAVALGVSGCASFTDSRQVRAGEPRSVGQTASDASITAKVKTAFAADDLVKARNIDVDTLRGVVTLTGTVQSGAERDRAVALAKRTEGVLAVQSNLRTAG